LETLEAFVKSKNLNSNAFISADNAKRISTSPFDLLSPSSSSSSSTPSPSRLRSDSSLQSLNPISHVESFADDISLKLIEIIIFISKSAELIPRRDSEAEPYINPMTATLPTFNSSRIHLILNTIANLFYLNERMSLLWEQRRGHDALIRIMTFYNISFQDDSNATKRSEEEVVFLIVKACSRCLGTRYTFTTAHSFT
jgi:hypothetical protein